MKTTPKPPSHLSKESKRLWTDIVTEYIFDDAASLSVLQTALEARDRLQECRERINKEGLTVLDRFGQTRPHPLLSAERDARSGVLQGFKMLGLDPGRAMS